jgi:hypothetical protein
MTKEGYCPVYSHGVDKDRSQDDRCAYHQRNQNRDSMYLRHAFASASFWCDASRRIKAFALFEFADPDVAEADGFALVSVGLELDWRGVVRFIEGLTYV